MKPRFRINKMGSHYDGTRRIFLTPLNKEAENLWQNGNFGLVVYQH